MRKLHDLNIVEKNIALRLDLNVPIQGDKVLDDTRILASIPTIQYLLNANCRILIISHLGRPEEGIFDAANSLEPVAKYLSELVDVDVSLNKKLTRDACFHSFDSPITMLENIRCFVGEKDMIKTFLEILLAFAMSMYLMHLEHPIEPNHRLMVQY